MTDVVTRRGRGGARQLNVPRALTCLACGTCSEYRKTGHLPKLCGECRQTLQYCPTCQHVEPLDAFYGSQGPGSRCRACCAAPGVARRCAGCGETFLRVGRGGKTLQPERLHLCDACETTSKWCATCGNVQPLEAFSKSTGKRDGRTSSCKACNRAKNAARSARDRLRRVVKRYGITLAEWDAMYVAQAGLCACCGQPPAPDSKGLVVDHNHATGVVRSLLCTPCNIGLGHFKDDPDLLRQAAAYLEREAGVR